MNNLSLSPPEFIRRKQRALSKSISGKKTIYLDLCHWIAVRDAARDTQANVDKSELLLLLKRSAAQGAIVCPASESIFVELQKQQDPTSRAATAQLIQELSGGVSIVPVTERVCLEIEFLLRNPAPNADTTERHELVWTKIAYVLGHVWPALDGWDRSSQVWIQESFLDRMWNTPLVELQKVVESSEFDPYGSFTALAAQLNLESKAAASSLVSYENALHDEIIGGAQVCAEIGLDIWLEYVNRQPGAPESSAFDRDRARDVLHGLLVGVMKSPELARKFLPTMHVQAVLHANRRWNRAENIKANDFFDFQHAAAALAYCDVFLTEKPLAASIRRKKSGLSSRYSCKVASTADEAIEVLRKVI